MMAETQQPVTVGEIREKLRDLSIATNDTTTARSPAERRTRALFAQEQARALMHLLHYYADRR